MNRKNLKGYLRNIGLEGFSESYRNRRGTIIYVSDKQQSIYVDIPGDEELIQSDLESFLYNKQETTTLQYFIPNYLRVIKVLLSKDKVARRWFNKRVKNFIFVGKPFRYYLNQDGSINWNLVSTITGKSLKELLFFIEDNYDSNWGNYNPYKDSQLKISKIELND